MKIKNHLKLAVQDGFDSLINNKDFKDISVYNRNLLTLIYIEVFEEYLDLDKIDNLVQKIQLPKNEKTSKMINDYIDTVKPILGNK